MGVYIANMAKPSCCERCILQDGEMCFAIDDGGDGLSLFSLEDLRDFCIKRRDDCPLEEIEEWNSYSNGKIYAPKGTFQKIYDEERRNDE